MGKKMKKPGKGGIVLMSLLLVIMIVVNSAASYFSAFLDNYFTPKRVDTEASASTLLEAQNKIKEVVGEGSVLLTNNNGALPFADGESVNVFGFGSTDPIYGGTGSGSSDTSSAIGFYDGLDMAGINYNKEIYDFYQGLGLVRPEQGGYEGADYTMVEASKEAYSSELMNDAKNFSDTAVIFISRIGGEGSDCPKDMHADGWSDTDDGKHYLELTDDEIDLFDLVCNEYDFGKVVVIVNSSNAMELGFLETYDVDSCLWVGGPGAVGFEAVGQILAGDINPSGKLPDTYIYDLTQEPTYYNLGDYTYTNVKYKELTYDSTGWIVTGTQDAPLKYIDYEEGIYVGYRYYETRFIDNETGECDEAAYQSLVQFPFGYGLSYTSFKQEISNHTEDADGNITIDVTVTNTGDRAGKDVVEVYYTAPYTIGGIEKSNVVLVDYGKTESIEPGASEVVSITFNQEDMASYDDLRIKSENGAYVLEAGTYKINIQSDAHNVIDSFDYAVASDVIYDDNHAGARSTDGVAATNLFDDCKDDGSGEITYFSRADWEGTMPTAEVKERAARDSMQEEVDSVYTLEEEEFDVTTDANNGLTLSELNGVAKDDERWQQLVEQMSVDELITLTGFGGHQTAAITSIDKAATTDENGPTGISAMQANDENGASYCSEPVMAATWNNDLIYELGQCLGAEMKAHGLDGLYGPAMNIHRSAFSGRNFEYYSEDGYLSGKMGAAEVSGIQSNGTSYVYMKHYAINDQETNRFSGTVWANEQGMREIYLKGFELTVKEGGAKACMESMNMLGTKWTGANYGMMTTVLDDEWGFEGFIVTDYVSAGYMDVDHGVRAGVDTMDDYMGAPGDDTSNAGIHYMQESAKDILYITANSDAQISYEGQGLLLWNWLIIGFNIIFGGVFILLLVLRIKKSKDYKAAMANQTLDQ